jgi:phosphoribosylanthranilate isomerase
MLLKVCGLNDIYSYSACLENEKVDFAGSIFYSKSKRYTNASCIQSSPKNVAVFVDETENEIRETASKYGFQNIQLHGNETIELCLNLKKDFIVIKAFGIDSSFDFNKLNKYENAVDYFLFDTKTEQHGGSGKKFNWQFLSQYTGRTPFFLSGGIKPEDTEMILNFKHPKLIGIDINSGFEIEPGVKNIELLNEFITQIKK